jgi:hypothetical protein
MHQNFKTFILVKTPHSFLSVLHTFQRKWWTSNLREMFIEPSETPFCLRNYILYKMKHDSEGEIEEYVYENWEELITYFPLIRHGPQRKQYLQQFFIPTGTCLPSHCLATLRRYTDRPTDSHLIWHGLHKKQCVQQFFFVLHICCHGNVFAMPFPSNDMGNIVIST